MGSGIPIKSKTTKNAKDRNAAFVLRGGSCSLKIQFIIKLEEMRYMLVGIWHGFRLNILIYKTIM